MGLLNGVTLGNVTNDQPLTVVRGTGGYSLLFQLRDGAQPVLPTDPVPNKTDLTVVGTYFLFMVKLADYDSRTGLPVPDGSALLTKDSRLGAILIRTPRINGVVEVPILSTDTTTVDGYGNPLMPNGVELRWSLKLFLSNGAGIVSEQIPLAGPWTVYDRSVQGV